MSTLNIIKKFIGSSYVLEKTALEIYEKLPVYLRNRIFLGSTFFRWKAFLKESQYWDLERLRDYQLEQLKNMLKHSLKNVPYYRKLFPDYGFHPEKMQSLEDIKVLPYLTKETVRDRLDEFLDERVPKRLFTQELTSGSTGIPLTIFKTEESTSISLALRTDVLDRIGYTPECREVVFWNRINIGRRLNLPCLRYGNKLLFSNQYRTDEWFLKYVEMMRRLKPDFIMGFPSSLCLFSAFIKNRKLLSSKGVKAVVSYAETLYDWQRNLIEEVFNARVFSMYGMEELVAFGGECEYSPYIHFYPQYGLPEFEIFHNSDSEIVATGFTNYAMPFIRYKMDDIVDGISTLCPKCNRHYQVVDNIEGRVHDFLINKEGNIIPRIVQLIMYFPNVKQCQFFQEEAGKAYLRIVRAESYSAADTSFIMSIISEMIKLSNGTIDIEIEFVEYIPRTYSGKITIIDQRLDVRKFLQI